MKKNNSIFLNYKKQIKNAIDDLKTPGKRHLQIPNLLTLMRLTAPCFIIPAAALGSVPLILGLTAFFSLTDCFDGFVARKWDLTSELGATLDAVTDKVFASTLLLAASFSNPILLCNLGLECTIAGINTYKKLNDIPVKSSFVGKVKTWFLFCLSGLGIISSVFYIDYIFNTLMIATTLMQVITITSYLPLNYKKKQLKINLDNGVTTFNSIDCDIKNGELKKEKKLEINSSDLKIKKQKIKYLEQLKLMKNFLIFPQINLNSEENLDINSNNYVKSKKDDLKK